MSALRLLAVALALAATASLAVGSVGFSEVSAERGVQISVAPNDEAYVGVTACTNGQGNGDVVHLRVSNRFVDPFAVTSVTSDDAAIHRGWSQEPSGDTTVAPGESRNLTQKFADGVQTVEVALTGDGFDATVTAQVEQSLGPACPGQGESEEDGPTSRSTDGDGDGTDDGDDSGDADGDDDDADDDESEEGDGGEENTAENDDD